MAWLYTQLQEVKTRGEQAIRADILATQKQPNPRQASLVAAFLERTSLSLADCERLMPDVAHRTLQRDLKRLIEVGLVAEIGQGPTDPKRQYRWRGAEL